MSAQRAKQFLETLSKDESLRKQLAVADSYDSRKKIIDAAGFADVSLDDIKEVQAAQVRSEELSDAELEAVAGGRTATWTVVIATTVAATIVGAATVGLIP
jgi:predicted ribosomally synthesized peptide with nif11-like leader